MDSDTPSDHNRYSDAKDPLLESGTLGIRSTKLRWIALLLACSSNFGPFFCFDNPQALQTYLQADLQISDSQFALLYSVYSFPNIVLPLIGGAIIDKLGVRIAIILFATFLIGGQVVVTIGAANLSYGLMIFGRVLFGLGGESLTVSQSSITAKWFAGKELAFAMGATLCISRLGSSLNSFLSPKIYLSSGELYTPFLVGAILCVVSWAGSLTLCLIDKRADAQEGTVQRSQDESDQIKLADLKKLSLLFYLLLFNCFFLYGAFFGLNNNLNDMMVKRFGFSPSDAGNFIPIVYLCSAVITPFFGMFTDKYGKRIIFMFIASVIFLLDHIIIAFLNDHPADDPNYGMVGALGGIGIFYSTYAAIFWPCVPLVVPAKVTGTAYGVITALQNLMLAIIPLVLSAIQEGTESFHQGYFWSEICLAIVVGFGLVITAWMYFVDIKKGGRLNRPGTNRASSSKVRSFVSGR